jgi:hypothetical protein
MKKAWVQEVEEEGAGAREGPGSLSFLLRCIFFPLLAVKMGFQ